MAIPVTNTVSNSAAALGGPLSVSAGDLSGLVSPQAAGKGTPLFTLDAQTQSRIVQKAFVEQLQANPELLNKTPDEVGRLLTNVPPGAFQKAIAALGVDTEDKTLGEILNQVPPAAAKKIIGEWFKGLAPGQQAVVLGVAAGVVLATQGLDGFRNLGLKATLIKSPQGELAVALVPDASTKRLAGQVSGQLTIPLGKPGNQLKLEGQVATDGTALFKAGLGIVLNSQSKLDLGVAATNTGVAASVEYSNGSFKLGSGLSEKGRINVNAGVNLTPNIRLEATVNDETKGNSIAATGRWALR